LDAGGAERAWGGPETVDKQKQEMVAKLRKRCQELKEAANYAMHEQTLLSTRHKAVERELHRQERVLHTLRQMQALDVGISNDFLNMLKLERNRLPVFQRKLQDLTAAIAERETKIGALKHQSQFTSLIELQVELATWQHEARRLGSMLEEISLGMESGQLKIETELYQERANRFQTERAAGNQKLKELQQRLQEEKVKAETMRSAYEAETTAFAEERKKLDEVMHSLEEVTIRRKALQQQEEENAGKEWDSYHAQLTQEVSENQTLLEDLLSTEKNSYLPHQLVTNAVYQGAIQDLNRTVLGSLEALRRQAALSTEPDSLLLQGLRSNDVTTDGYIPHDRVEQILTQKLNENSSLGKELANALAGQIKSSIEGSAGSRSSSPSAKGKGYRLLDLAVAFERLSGASFGNAMPSLPDTRPLKRVCLRKGLRAETWRKQLLDVDSVDNLIALLRTQLGLPQGQVDLWCNYWKAAGGGAQTEGGSVGSVAILARTGTSEVSLPESLYNAWWARIQEALAEERDAMHQNFAYAIRGEGISAAHVPQDHFEKTCQDILSAWLSHDDVLLLALWACPLHAPEIEEVDLKAVFSLMH